MLCDTGPIVAVLDADDFYHQRACHAILSMPIGGWLTTCSCVTEAMYLLGKLDGHRGQEKLWRQIESGLLLVREIEVEMALRMRSLMAQYSDAPMDFADASLVVLAESSGDHTIFSFDQHFYSYLIHDRAPFDVIP